MAFVKRLLSCLLDCHQNESEEFRSSELCPHTNFLKKSRGNWESGDASVLIMLGIVFPETHSVSAVVICDLMHVLAVLPSPATQKTALLNPELGCSRRGLRDGPLPAAPRPQ